MLCLLVFLHEWGHFLAARSFGVRVEVFSIGLGPRLLKWKRGSTEYRLSLLPFGGYVKMAGDSAFKPRSGAADEFLSKSRWQRVVIALAGPAMNLIATFLFFWFSFWLIGLPYPAYLAQAANVAAVAQDSQGSEIRVGDVISQVNGVSTPTWDSVFARAKAAARDSEVNLIVIRNGRPIALTVKAPEKPDDMSYLGYPLVRPKIDEVASNTRASKAGLKPGDVVSSVNGDALVTWPQFVDMVRESSEPYPVVVVERGGRAVPLQVTEPPNAKLADDPIGASPKLTNIYHRQGFIISGKAAFFMTVFCVEQIADIVRGLFSSRISVRELQGVVGIAQQSGHAVSHGPANFVDLMALISLNLGLLNLLPIPVLDGGHVLILAIEGVFRRDINYAVKRRFVQAGLVLLLALGALAMFSDIQRIIQTYN